LPIPLLQGWVVDQLVVLEMQGTGPVAGGADRLGLGSGAAGTSNSSRVAWSIGLALAATAALHLVRAGLSWAIAARMARISQEVVVALRGALHRKLMRLPMAYFDAQQTGRLMARVTSDVGSILTFIRSGILQLLNDLILSVAIAALLIWLQWQLALAALVAVPLYAINQRLFFKRLRRLSDEIRAQIASLYALLSERVSAVRVVRSFAKEDAELAALDERIDRHRALSWENTRTAAALSALATLISGLGTVFVIGYGVLLVGRGGLTVGELLAFYALVGQLYAPIVRLTQFQATALATQVSVERLYEVFDEPEPVRDRPGARPIVRPQGALQYQNVSFAYKPDGPLVLHDINLAIEPGMTVGILGPSGAGKSTLLALAPRLYDLTEANLETPVAEADSNSESRATNPNPTPSLTLNPNLTPNSATLAAAPVNPSHGANQGVVRFDGRDVRDWRLADLRRAVALVPQQALLFEGTIRSNLLYANPEATEPQILRALEIADLAGSVASFPMGLDTPVGERGLSLSGGQRQRLALARAIVAEPAVLLLDDCTSALDSETEARIQQALADSLPGRTIVVVSHKVASVRHADLIVVLEHGTVVEQGTHDELLEQNGPYAETYHQQTAPLAL
jgi:ABC-type multidrug transport system fused ATPase/permease subunit